MYLPVLVLIQYTNVTDGWTLNDSTIDHAMCNVAWQK